MRKHIEEDVINFVPGNIRGRGLHFRTRKHTEADVLTFVRELIVIMESENIYSTSDIGPYGVGLFLLRANF